MFKKVLASATLVAVMTSMLGMTAFASAPATPEWDTNGGKATVEGDGVAVEPIIQVELPGDLSFGINPLRLDADEDGTADQQIVRVDYTITNYSNVDVLVTAETKATVGDKVELLDVKVAADAYDANSDELLPSTTPGNKAMWLVQLLPTKDATITDGVGVLGLTDLNYDGADIDTTIKGYSIKATANEVNFKLEKFDYKTETLKPSNVSGFAFSGAVDPDATFVEGDVKVSTVFTLKTLTDKQSTGSYELVDDPSGSAKFGATVVQEKSATPNP